MKKQIILLAFITLASLTYAQEVLTEKGGASIAVAARLEVQEVYQTMSKGQHNSFILQLPGDAEKTAISVWKDLMKEYKGRAKKKSGEYVSETEKMTQLGALVTVYAKFDRQEVSVWFERDGNFISTETDPGSFSFIEELLNDYKFNLKKELTMQNVEDQEKQLKSLEKDFSKLERENQRLHDTIERAKKAIAEAEQGIEVNLKNQEAKQAEIETQKTVVEDAKLSHESIVKYKKSRQ
ncbi:MAG: hypothetical protein K9J37_14785 [Saprospiraceae bacterium]|nr:hypothetical protein [Saprospiraceae bacterium]MCF8251174.1 hypothetical protein [Saprospiraceae bacterium]MCF8281897.1 hypothetical protein [Bacteroidales bacterium]MCF8312986.1 hypothetical protein [Saprospiraceae bacterium]MCF8441433.1 hypothetical protein [Saprospiraceae bacterium]